MSSKKGNPLGGGLFILGRGVKQKKRGGALNFFGVWQRIKVGIPKSRSSPPP